MDDIDYLLMTHLAPTIGHLVPVFSAPSGRPRSDVEFRADLTHQTDDGLFLPVPESVVWLSRVRPKLCPASPCSI